MTAFNGVPCRQCGLAEKHEVHRLATGWVHTGGGLSVDAHSYEPSRDSLEAVACELLAACELANEALSHIRMRSGREANARTACQLAVSHARRIGVKPPDKGEPTGEGGR